MKKRGSWKDFFYFTRSERYGAWILGVLLVLSFLLPRANIFEPTTQADFSKLNQAVALWQQRGPAGELDRELAVVAREQVEASEQPELFFFDPNTVSKEELRRLGFSEKVASTLLNYRNSGARFWQSEDLLKVYGVSESFFRILEPYIRIEKGKKEAEDEVTVIHTAVEGSSQVKSSDHSKRLVQTIDINAATQQDWESLPGIGPYYAKRILSFREALGGFYSVEQVGETYRLPDSVFQKIQSYLLLQTPPQLLHINEISVEDLARHPYFSKKQAAVIVRYREQYGPFSTLEQLVKTRVVETAELSKLRPYISFETP